MSDLNLVLVHSIANVPVQIKMGGRWSDGSDDDTTNVLLWCSEKQKKNKFKTGNRKGKHDKVQSTQLQN